MSDTDISPEDQARLHELSEALRQEFASNQHEQRTIEDVIELKDDALETLKHILKHSQSEPLRANVAKWVYEKVLDSEKAGDENELAELIKGMSRASEKEVVDGGN